ncbi:MAG: leucine-rich repeat domain-containing protein [Armatimonadetes bacterium]|nr:leucine-rich repeat domain-containing protein [Candidatus Hippobium faecium]
MKKFLIIVILLVSLFLIFSKIYYKYFEIHKGVLTKYKGNSETVTVPFGVMEIKKGAFEITDDGISIKKLIIPGTVRKIDKYAFAYICEGDYDSIEEVVFNKGLKEIGEYAFYGAYIKEITIPGTVEKIGNGAFSECSLEKVILNEGLKEIGEYAFEGTHIKEITIPKTVENIGNGVFNSCPYLETVNVDDNPNFVFEDGVLYNKDKTKILCCRKDIYRFTVPKSVVEIGGFATCPIKEIIIPGNVRKIDDSAFSDVYDVNCEEFPRLEKVVLNEGLKEIGKNAFSETSINEINVPKSVEKINDYTFFCCRFLRKIILNEGLIEIGKNAFSETGIKEITVPKSVRKIGEGAFESCFSLEKVTLNEGLKEIGKRAFCDTLLKEIVIPKSVEKIDDEAFGENVKIIRK